MNLKGYSSFVAEATRIARDAAGIEANKPIEMTVTATIIKSLIFKATG
jgi:hypothetical protein